MGLFEKFKQDPAQRQELLKGKVKLTLEEEEKILKEEGPEALEKKRKEMEFATERQRDEEAQKKEVAEDKKPISCETTPGALSTQAEKKALEELKKNKERD